MKSDIVYILCKLERIFPPIFFLIMVHLMIHLPEQVLLTSPIQFTWMFPIESNQSLNMMKLQRRSTANKSNRDKKTLHHHTRSRAFIYNAKELKDKGETSISLEVTHKRMTQQTTSMQLKCSKRLHENEALLMEKVDEIRDNVRKENPGIPEEDIDFYFDEQTQAIVFEKAFGHRNMKEIRGMGLVGSYGLSQGPDRSYTSRS
ncbi:hypothetical protein ACLB2K_012710 [Fragaria x ananassa]